jgi:hypothetical protein
MVRAECRSAADGAEPNIMVELAPAAGWGAGVGDVPPNIWVCWPAEGTGAAGGGGTGNDGDCGEGGTGAAPNIIVDCGEGWGCGAGAPWPAPNIMVERRSAAAAAAAAAGGGATGARGVGILALAGGAVGLGGGGWATVPAGGLAVKTSPQRVHCTGAPPGGMSLSSSMYTVLQRSQEICTAGPPPGVIGRRGPRASPGCDNSQ